MVVEPTCHVCGEGSLEVVGAFALLPRISSDCKALPAGGALGTCRACGTVQKPVDNRWREEVRAIYEAYSIYHQSDGAEQAVFTSGGGAAVARSEHLVRRLIEEAGLPPRGRLLDVGCGNGALLAAFARLRPGWALAGTELSDKHRAQVMKIPGVEAMHACPPDQVPGEFDLVTLVHVLEHVPQPVEFVRKLAGKVAAGGGLFIQAPHYLDNPFDLLVADHCTHFTRGTLEALLGRAGVAVRVMSTAWVAKELSAVVGGKI